MEDNTRPESLKNACNLNLCGIFNYFLKVDLEVAGLLQGKRTLLHQLMREMGFGYRHVNNKRNYYEQPRILEQRYSYLDEGGGTEQRKGQWCISMKHGAMNIMGKN